MTQVTIYHNPRCSKSRKTLALLRDHGVEPQIVEYLHDKPDVETLRELLRKLGLEPGHLIRDKEYRALKLPATEDPQELVVRMVQHPEIIQRPIVVKGERACLGRPPENVIELL